MTMVERVARGIEDVVASHPSELLSSAWLNQIARAAIEAMREPSEAMMTAGASALTGGPPWKDEAIACWTAAIDAALSEQSA